MHRFDRIATYTQMSSNTLDTPGTDRQLSDLFTQANLEILNEMNRLNQMRSGETQQQQPQPVMASLGQQQRSLPSLPTQPLQMQQQSFPTNNFNLNDMNFAFPMAFQGQMQNPSLQNLISPATIVQDHTRGLQQENKYDDDDDSISAIYPL